jgi:uncharacterized membrane protein
MSVGVEAMRVEAAPDESPAAPLARMGIAVLALIGVMVSAYLSLYKFGVLGVLECSLGGCVTVQGSPYAWFPPRTIVDSSPPVAVWGMGAYLTLLAIALVGVQPRWLTARWVALSLFTISGLGVLFSAWLTYLEAFVINAWCQWCVVSAILITLIFLLSIPGLRRPPGASVPDHRQEG